MALRLNAELLPLLPREAGKNWVFDGYVDPITREVAWSRFWTGQFDFTGVTWDNPRTLTMITPRHVVMAKHYVRPAGSAVIFHDKRGQEVQRVLMGFVKLPGKWDVAVGILNEAMPVGVKHYKLLEPSEKLHTDMLGTLALVTDGKRKVHVHECGSMPPEMISFRFPRSLPEGFYAPLVKGDSGNPSFVMVRGEPVLIETHFLGGAGVGPFYGSALIQAEIRAAIVELAVQFGGADYSFQTVRP
ncbi:MAG: hypothetical protein ACI8XO_001289 [Verrucomicrobiales bacterium]|jgi:hypothetical protein